MSAAGPLGDAEQQADHQRRQSSPANCSASSGRTACEQPGLLRASHDFAHGGAACLESDRIERTRHLRGLDDLGDRQPEYGNDCGIAYLAYKLGSKRSQHLRQGGSIAQHGQLGGHVQPLGALADAGDQHFRCLLPTSAYSSRFDTRARVAISSMLAVA